MEEEFLATYRLVKKLIKNKKINQAKDLILDSLNKNPNNDQAWFLLSLMLASPEKKLYALKHAIKINPDNKDAKSYLDKIQYTEENNIKEFSRDFSENENKNIDFHDARSANFDTKPDLLEERLQSENKDAVSTKDIIDNNLNDNEIENLREELFNHGFKDTEIKKNKQNNRTKEEYINGEDAVNRELDIPVKKQKFRLLIILTILLLIASIYFLFANGYINNQSVNKINSFFSEKIGATSTNSKSASNILTNEGSIAISNNSSLFEDAEKIVVTQIPSPAPIIMPTQTIQPTETLVPLSAYIEEQIKNIQNNVITIRGLNSVNNVNTYMVTKSYLQDLLINRFDGEKYIEESLIEMEVLDLFGLVNADYNLVNHAINAWTEARGGLYLPSEKAIYFNGTNLNIIEQYIFTIEYAQSLLGNNYEIMNIGENSDCWNFLHECQALTAFYKGDSLLISENWVNSYLKDSEKSLINNLIPQYYFITSASPSRFSDEDLSFNSIYGLEFARSLFDFGGWEYLNSAYEDPPTTTEQIMHPEKYITRENKIIVNSKNIEIVLGESWERIKVSELGEWRTYLILSSGEDANAQLEKELSLNAAAGWGGDEYQYYRNNGSNETVLVVNWVMDSLQDKDELYEALKLHISKKMDTTVTIEGDLFCWENLTYSCIQSDGLEIVWILSPDIEISNEIMRLYFD